MIEDKLTHDERVRLESVAQANLATQGRYPNGETLLDLAGRIERFVRDPEPAPGDLK